MTIAEDLLSLFFPKICFSCNRSLYRNEECICTQCIYHLPKTGYRLRDENPVTRLFWGRVPVQSAASYLLFSKGGKVQDLIHQFKYEGKKEIGITLGKLYGKHLAESFSSSGIDAIVAVPLHHKKEKKRGYNQAEVFGEGLSIELAKPIINKALERISLSETQTRKSRFSRWKNVEQVFQVRDSSQLEGKHILLVDDVVTTGSTLEACANKILELRGTKVSVASIAYTQ
jgi:ComF family protein